MDNSLILNYIKTKYPHLAEKSLQDTNKQAIGALKSRIQELDKATSRLNTQFIAIYSSAFVALVMVLFLAIFLFVL